MVSENNASVLEMYQWAVDVFQRLHPDIPPIPAGDVAGLLTAQRARNGRDTAASRHDTAIARWLSSLRVW